MCAGILKKKRGFSRREKPLFSIAERLWPIIRNEQLADFFAPFSLGADGAPYAQPMNMKWSIELVEKVIVWVGIFGIRIAEQKACPARCHRFKKFCQGTLIVVIKSILRIGGEARCGGKRAIGRIQINEGFGIDEIRGLRVAAAN